MKKFLAKYVVSSTLMIISLVILVLNFIGLGKHPFLIIFISFLIGLYALSCNPSFKNGNKAERRNYFEGFIISSVLLLGFGLTRQYELVTEFNKPCWSPNGKQIAFIMERRLTKYHPGLLGDVPINQWDKYYLCIMDYNGKNFKILKETNRQDGDPRKYLESYSVLWPSTNTIVYNQLMQDNFHSSKFQGKAYKIHPGGSGVEELWQWDEKSEYQDVYWLTPKEDYLLLAKYTDKGRIYATYDRRENKIKKELLFIGQLYGSYNDNTVAINYDRHLTIINLDTLISKQVDWKENEVFEKLLTGYERGILSPDQSMYAEEGGVWTVGSNKVVSDFYVKPRRSYLFNIFPK